MFNHIRIQNFLSHKDTFLEFHPGVNVFIGLSDKGKSAAIKALQWAINNRPTGSEMVSWWGGDTSVCVSMDDNKHIVERVKTEDGKNIYKFNLVSNPYKAFGKSVPEEVKKVFNMGDINWLTQIEPPYLLHPGISPGKIAEELNKITNLSIIDESLGRAKQEGKKVKTAIDINTTLIEEWEEKLKKFDNLDEMEKDVIQLENIKNSLNEKRNKHISLSHLIEATKETEERLLELTWIEKAKLDIDNTLLISKQILRIGTKAGLIYKLLEAIKISNNKLKHIEYVTKAKKEIDKSLNVIKRIKKQKEIQGMLASILYKIKNSEKRLQETNTALKEKQKQFYELFPDHCPLCGSVKNLKKK